MRQASSEKPEVKNETVRHDTKVTFSKNNYWGFEYLVFDIPLPHNPSVRMSMKKTEYEKDNYCAVIVDSKTFLELWRNTPYKGHADIANGNPKTWINDSKYSEAVRCFSLSLKNPVPLADISHGISERSIVSQKFLSFGKSIRHEIFHYVNFTDGITRTIWLLTQGCTAFPVKCEASKAEVLFDACGAAGYTLRELVDLVTNTPEPIK